MNRNNINIYEQKCIDNSYNQQKYRNNINIYEQKYIDNIINRNNINIYKQKYRSKHKSLAQKRGHFGIGAQKGGSLRTRLRLAHPELGSEGRVSHAVEQGVDQLGEHRAFTLYCRFI